MRFNLNLNDSTINTIQDAVNEIALPKSASEFYDIEQRIQNLTSRLGDEILINKLEEIHSDDEFIKNVIKQKKAGSDKPLINKGWRPVSILLLGGTKVVIDTPYLRINYGKFLNRKLKKRGKKGSGSYPVLESLGIIDRVSPATRSEIALHAVQSSSYKEAVYMLQRRGIKCNTTNLKRITVVTAKEDISFRDAALSAAMDMPVPTDGPLSGLKVRVSVDGGRTRTRINKKGRKTKKNRHRFYRPWREPRVVVIDVINDDGSYDSLRLPLSDVIIDDADAVFYLITGYLRLLGAAHSKVIEFISDGADWIWDRIDKMVEMAELPKDRLILVLDFYHACEHISTSLELISNLSKKDRKKLFKNLRHILRHDLNGNVKIIQKLKELRTIDNANDMDDALKYFEKHIDHMRYKFYEKIGLPLGSGQVESAVRRIINLRFKAPGTFWKEKTAEYLMHLRAYFKTGRWDELVERLLKGEFLIPIFETS